MWEHLKLKPEFKLSDMCAYVTYYTTLAATNKSHIAKLQDLLKVFLKNGLKTSLKKCQFLRKELQNRGNMIFIKDKSVCVKPFRSWLEGI